MMTIDDYRRDRIVMTSTDGRVAKISIVVLQTCLPVYQSLLGVRISWLTQLDAMASLSQRDQHPSWLAHHVRNKDK
jgi:hypothetical protein